MHYPRQTAGAGQPARLIWPQALDGPGHRRPSRPGPFLRQTGAPAPSPAQRRTRHRIGTCPGRQLRRIAPLPPAGSSPAGPGWAALTPAASPCWWAPGAAPGCPATPRRPAGRTPPRRTGPIGDHAPW